MKLNFRLTTLSAVMALGLLTACGGDSTSSGTPLRISSVLPGTLTPGATVTVYGTMLSGVQAQLDGQAVAAVNISGGIRFTLPENVVAGEHSLTLKQAGATQSTTLVIHPRLDSAVLDGQQLLLSGAGWSGQPAPTISIRVGDQPLMTSTFTSSMLTVTLPRAAAYGTVPVQLTVNGQDSTLSSVTREAGAIKGTLSLPAGTINSSPLHIQSAAIATEPALKLLVTLRSTVPTARFSQVLSGLERTDFEPALSVARLTFKTPTDATQARAVLQSWPEVTQVNLDGHLALDGSEKLESAAPRPAGVLNSQGLSVPTPSPDQWHLPLLHLQEAWSQTQGAGVVVAVVDTGILGSHPDLQGNILSGYNFVDNNTDTTDVYGHGTHVAGLIAAHGVAWGVAPAATLLPVKVMRNGAGGSALDVARGILYAAGLLPDRVNPTPAQIINLSLGIDGSDPTIEQAVRKALDAGIIVVVAAGNTGGALASPANVPGVFAVGAVAGPSLTYIPSYSNWGTGLTISSYGGDITQDQDHNGVMDGILSTDLAADGQSPSYSLRNGTSMAAPLVTGIVALMKAQGLASALLPGVLKGSAQDLYVAGYDLRTGYGLATGATVMLSPSRTYVLALDAQSQLVAWTPVAADGSFLLGNLPPGESLTLMAATDANHDGVVDQVGEAVTVLPNQVVTAGNIQTVQFSPLSTTTTPQSITLHTP